VAATGNLTIEGLTLQGGSVIDSGGAGLLNRGRLILTNSILADNSALAFSGGLYNTGNGTLRLTNSTLIGNQAICGHGGGLFNNMS
jgi:hypothetical protein